MRRAKGSAIGRVETLLPALRSTVAERTEAAAARADIVDIPALHRSLAAKKVAIPILIAFARELAGTAGDPPEDEPPAAEPPPPGGTHEPPKSGARQAVQQAPRWTKTHRPGPFDVLTWEEAFSVPWVEGDEAIEVGSGEG